ncbi:MAG: DUF3095 domain-containing protein [Flavobacteriaceae bacterium]
MLDDPLDFYRRLPAFADFDEVLRQEVYTPLPDDWSIAVTDVERSTAAIAAGRYKAVNMAGAAGIAAVTNALGSDDFPFVFGGDGTAMAFPEALTPQVAEALAATRRMAEEEMQLGLRVGIVPVREVRDAGHDVRVARYMASRNASFAMFSGNGIAWCEKRLKEGEIPLREAPAGARPDLTGLSCRWEPIKPRNGVILSVLAVPRDGESNFAEAARDVIRLAEGAPGMGRPVEPSRMRMRVFNRGGSLEAHATHGRLPAWLRYLLLLAYYAFAKLLFVLRLGVGRFDPVHYLETLSANSDFRKFDDGLRMTIDCDEATAAAIEERLSRAEAQGVLHYGVHRQDAALMTCLVFTPMADDHIHFIDGASGGYAQAAASLKASMAAV